MHFLVGGIVALRHDTRMRFDRRFLLSSTTFKTKLTGHGFKARSVKPGWRLATGGLLLASFLSIPLLSIAATSPSDIMPPPSRAPRTPVERQRLPEPEIPAELAGGAVAIDGQTLRLKGGSRDLTVRLAGVTAPPISSTEGVAARSALDMILREQTINCTRRDRDSEGRAVMSCTYNGGRDVAQALLATGTVLFSRGTNVPAELATVYRGAEEIAQSRHTGLWSRPIASSQPSSLQPLAATPVAATTNVPASAPVVHTAPVQVAAPVAAAPVAVTAAQPSIPVISMGGAPASAPVATPAPVATRTVEAAPSFVVTNEEPMVSSTTVRFLQAMGLMGFLFGMLAWLDARHLRRSRYAHELEIQSERTVVAAALAGELAAARDICESRAAQIAASPAGTPIKWPRLRTYIYQAHVEHIGLLGPTLARQIASIYGQMADYSGKADGSESGMAPAAMARTLARLCGYIEITMEGLTEVEHTGEPYYPTGLLADSNAGDKRANQLAHNVTNGTAATKPTSRLPESPTTKSIATKPQAPKPATTSPAYTQQVKTPTPHAQPVAEADAEIEAEAEIEPMEIGMPKETRIESAAEPVVEAVKAEAVKSEAHDMIRGPEEVEEMVEEEEVTATVETMEAAPQEVVAQTTTITTGTTTTTSDSPAETAPTAPTVVSVPNKPGMNTARSQRLMRQRQRAAEMLKAESVQAKLQREMGSDDGDLIIGEGEAVA